MIEFVDMDQHAKLWITQVRSAARHFQPSQRDLRKYLSVRIGNASGRKGKCGCSCALQANDGVCGRGRLSGIRKGSTTMELRMREAFGSEEGECFLPRVLELSDLAFIIQPTVPMGEQARWRIHIQ